MHWRGTRGQLPIRENASVYGRISKFGNCPGSAPLICTARMNDIEPEAWLTDIIARIGAHPINRLAELLPWNWSPPATQSVAA